MFGEESTESSEESQDNSILREDFNFQLTTSKYKSQIGELDAYFIEETGKYFKEM